MKTADEWATEIIQFMQKHPVTTFSAAREQIKGIVERVQEDALPPEAPSPNPTIQ